MFIHRPFFLECLSQGNKQKRSASRALFFAALFAQLLQAFEAIEHILNGKLLRALKVRR